jgi:hypothetical protein
MKAEVILGLLSSLGKNLKISFCGVRKPRLPPKELMVNGK